MGTFFSRSPSQSLGMRRKGDNHQRIAETEPYLDADGNGYEGSNKVPVHTYQQWQSMTDQKQTSYPHGKSIIHSYLHVTPFRAHVTWIICQTSLSLSLFLSLFFVHLLEFAIYQVEPSSENFCISFSVNVPTTLMANATIPLWSYHADHTFHQSNLAPMVAASRPAFDYHQQSSLSTNNILNVQPESATIGNVASKKVQFVPPSRQHRTSPVKPLKNTRSWQESNHTAQSVSSQPVMKSKRLPNHLSTHRSIFVIPIAAESPVSKMKAVYVPIDHNATIAERRMIDAQHQRHQSNDRSLSDQLSKTHRSKSHQHRYQIDSPLPIGNIHSSDSVDTRPLKSSSAHRSTSTSQSIPNGVQTSSTKMKKYRSEHVSGKNEQRPSRRHRHPTSVAPKEESSHPQMRIRASDHQHSTAPMMRITLARPDQARQKQTATHTRTSTKDSHARSHLQIALFWIITHRILHSLLYWNKALSSCHHVRKNIDKPLIWLRPSEPR